MTLKYYRCKKKWICLEKSPFRLALESANGAHHRLISLSRNRGKQKGHDPHWLPAITFTSQNSSLTSIDYIDHKRNLFTDLQRSDLLQEDILCWSLESVSITRRNSWMVSSGDISCKRSSSMIFEDQVYYGNVLLVDFYISYYYSRKFVIDL